MNTRTLLALLWLLLAAPLAPGQLQPATEPPAQKKVERPTTEIPREGCVTAECHPGIKDRKFLHGPINANACDSCHKLTDAAKHTFQQQRSREQNCTLCHTVEVEPGAVVHQPFAEGECLSCHDPHGSNETAMLRGNRYADSCMMCHKDITGAHDLVHGPASAGACGACHKPHSSRNAKLLNAEGRDLCLRCHVSTGVQIRTKSVVHAPVLGDCQICHVPHATDFPSMLNADPSTLCTGCHKDIAHTVETASTQHAAVTTKRACLNCHTPHAGDFPRLLKSNETTICLECHNNTISLKDGTTLMNMKALITQGKSLHGAIAQQNCSACHEIHGGGHRRLLNNEFPTDVYLPFKESSYALCFSCHDRELVLQQNTNAVTGFRNGERNLHFVHVNRAEKGRSCRVCHDSHAASRDKHIRDETPFGPKGWRLPIKYEPLPDGGRCGAGCHSALEYNRSKPVAYPIAKDGAWKGADLVPGEAGPDPNDIPPKAPPSNKPPQDPPPK